MAGQQYKCQQGHYVKKQYNGKVCPTCRTMLEHQKGRKAPDQNASLNPNMHNATGVVQDMKMQKIYENYQKNHSRTAKTSIVVETNTNIQPKKGIVKKVSELERVNAVLAVTNSKDLAKYVVDDSATVRALVALSPHATAKMINFLAKDPDYAVRGATTISPKLSLDTIKHLAIDPEPYVRKHVAYNVSSTTPLMRKMVLHFYTDKDPEVRAAICSNPRTRNLVDFLKENPNYTASYAHRYSRYTPQPDKPKPARPVRVRNGKQNNRQKSSTTSRRTPSRRQKARPQTTKMLILTAIMRMAFGRR